MVDEPDCLVWQLLRRIDGNLDRVIEDVQDLKQCMVRCAERLRRIDLGLARIDSRLERIDLRLARWFPGS